MSLKLDKRSESNKHSLKFLTPQYNCSCLKNVLLSFDKLTTTFCLSFLTWFTLWTLFEKGMSTWCYVGRLKNPLVAHISPTHHDGMYGIMGRNLFWISYENINFRRRLWWSSMLAMTIRVVDFLNGGYKIRKIFA